MGEPLSATASVIALVTFAFQSSAGLYKAVRGFRSQDKDARALKDELNDLTNVLALLTDTVALHPNINFDHLKLPLHRCGRTCEEYGELIARCTRHSAGSRPSIRDWVTQRYLQGDITDFKMMISAYKSTINIALADTNLRVTAITPSVLEDYKDLISDTSNDLQDHLERLEKQIKSLTVNQPSCKPADFDGADLPTMLEEKESTQLGLRFCAQLSAQIERYELASRESADFSDRPSAHKHLKTGLGSAKGSIDSLVSRLQSHEEALNSQLQTMSSSSAASRDVATQISQLRDSRESIRQCIEIVSSASGSLVEERRNVFEDITMADNSYEFSVSTVGDLVTARQLSLNGRSRHVAGQLSSEDYQKSIDALTKLDMEHLRLSQTPDNRDSQSYASGISTDAAERFVDTYGRGSRLKRIGEQQRGHSTSWRAD